LLGVIAMFSALLIMLVLPLTNLSKLKNLQFRPFSKIIFFVFVVNFVILMIIGAKHVESPYIELGQISTILFFGYFLILVPIVTGIENFISNISCNNLK
jgi:ubiquinol-cytochrome c reductase cytochrome b subunit